jgi:hypothetical protein
MADATPAVSPPRRRMIDCAFRSIRQPVTCRREVAFFGHQV